MPRGYSLAFLNTKLESFDEQVIFCDSLVVVEVFISSKHMISFVLVSNRGTLYYELSSDETIMPLFSEI